MATRIPGVHKISDVILSRGIVDADAFDFFSSDHAVSDGNRPIPAGTLVFEAEEEMEIIIVEEEPSSGALFEFDLDGFVASTPPQPPATPPGVPVPYPNMTFEGDIGGDDFALA